MTHEQEAELTRIHALEWHMQQRELEKFVRRLCERIEDLTNDLQYLRNAPKF